ncbi:hypothetical protein GCM10023085_77820 [Actinomadura viridis]|uniref:Peptidoglycan hydrolase-like protein with peptidoglycan-binding domain n=1 Tax=Actinomadura viridis TaxID=58110 RepID=A0A931DNE2_9ACTN|nr:peptidoglycan-binding protein [Actinomadura viridis]MBG6090315.1 peptidoglycan hydrolase-like protein with peptidoglycan-binding domain [Actinomadura viridis]
MSAPPFQPPLMKYPPITRGPGVQRWQQQMRARGWNIAPDGEYGPISRRVCQNFQREHYLDPDGVVGPITWRAAWEAPGTVPPPAPPDVLQVGSYGEAVRTWEKQVDSRGWTIRNIDGAYDEETADVCRSMQSALGLPVTGRVDYRTWDAAWRERAAIPA